MHRIRDYILDKLSTRDKAQMQLITFPSGWHLERATWSWSPAAREQLHEAVGGKVLFDFDNSRSEPLWVRWMPRGYLGGALGQALMGRAAETLPAPSFGCLSLARIGTSQSSGLAEGAS